MSSITLRLGAARYTLGEEVKKDGATTQRQTLHFPVFPDGREQIALSTGEIFIAPSVGRSLKAPPRSIEGSLFLIRSAPRDEGNVGSMRYCGPQSGGIDFPGFEASIEFYGLIEAESFDTILENIRSGLQPSTVEIYFGFLTGPDRQSRHAAFEYGFEADGSGKTWDLSKIEDRMINFESIGFTFNLGSDKENPANTNLSQLSFAERLAQERKLIPWYERPFSFRDPLQISIGAVLFVLALMWHYS